MKRNLQLILFTSMLAFGSTAFGSKTESAIEIKDMRGLVLVNTGEAFLSAKKGQILKAGDQVYVLDRSVVVLAEEQGCHLKVNHNALLTLNNEGLCAVKQAQVKLMGTRFAAAIGLVEETKTDTSSGAIGAIGGIVIEEQPIEIAEEDVELPTPAAEESAFGSLASKLAVPATVLGAVTFSALAGGGGILGGDGDSGSPEADQQGSGTTPETDPVSPS